jgi:hypothetical protein
VFQRPRQQERVELFALAGTAGSPTEPCEHQCAMIAPGAALPAAVRRQQVGQVIGGERQPPAENVHRGGRAAGQVVRYPAKPRQRAELNCSTEPVLHTDVAAKPCSVVAGERKERDQVVLGDLVRPATQPGELGVGQEPNRHTARYPRSSVPDKAAAGRRPLKEPQTDAILSQPFPSDGYQSVEVVNRQGVTGYLSRTERPVSPRMRR